MTTLVLPVPGTTADYPAPDNWAELLVEALQALNAGKVEGFADPGADRIVFWDDSAGAWAAMSVTSPLEISGTTLQVNSATLAETIRDTMATALVAGTNITITPNDGSDTITIAASGGGGTPPDASETVKGIIELATNAEVQTGTDTVRAVTPAGLASRTATETRTGVAEIATAAEVSTGTDDARIVTPLKLKTQLDLKAPLASPAFTGNPTAPTPATSDDDTSIATTEWVKDVALLPSWFVAKGDLLAGFSAGNPGVVSVGANGLSLVADSASSFGMKWAETRGMYVGINAQTGTSYAPVLADQGKLVTCNNAGAITVTMPSNATVAFPIGTQIDFVTIGAGMITFVAGSGATVNGTPSLVTRAQYSAVTLIKIATDGWLAVGDLATP